MADDDNSSTSDDSLDFNSDKFDPIKALYSNKIRLPSACAPIYDNVCMFESRMKNPARVKKISQTGNDVVKAKEYSKQRFISSQGHEDPERSKTIGRGKKFKEGSNVLTKMPKILGPLGMLYECMESRIRIKVYTRNARGVRGHVEAYVAAFDKHWNLALEDCFEVWTRKRKRKAPAALDTKENEKTTRMMTMMMMMREEEEEEEKEEEKEMKERRRTTTSFVPKVVLKKIEGKTETLERHVPQMLLRGEQVAIIVKIN
ncbi:U7 snRNA-associated Sm-like protein LSm11 [Vespa mandarinia]|uniref:U7 snRNA-associated Sm-like protein LSm11 n=1 Tax=Vespa mandarinia TaxID=7446 RepID=UPI001616B7B1|nr:U7 snRNA-associated Sm-like protein LSm11 [Vespa mandarinia]